MVRNRRIAMGLLVVPDLMGSRRLTVEFESCSMESPDYIPVAESRQPPHYKLTISG